MTRLAQASAFDIATTSSVAPGFMHRLARHFARVEAAMTAQSRLSAIQPDTLSDTGRSAEDLTGAPSHDPALPFFLQAGFGRR